ncbi:RdgB/HAM1 family non-canonical purine NTP pyrophosphatase [Zoogloea sp.]|jgi:XTP/dITP diphosphohydrolase|uniref:RdgB/HAM1 family non-canonical purine NTP pyrophosphatase n=1 Tax=Zoogloea sp. TaxID=49181 RepID=UPI0035AEDAD6|nr:RdgB/HAM1 family non-canonical purine NTP pyrophosphatase [Rhodocyclales bacterium]
MKQLVLASGNAGKLKELSALLAPLGIEVLPQSAFNVSEAEEPHPSFVENALAKARHAARATGLPALADDSGLCVDALGGAPGVLSARFAGEPKSDARNNALLLERLAGETRRGARFYCALVLVRHADDPQPLIACGEWRGEILDAARGQGGFGYDPLFLIPDLEQTAAQVPAELKNVLSHRASAFRQLLEKLQAEADLS